jgi:hypothetical protein
MHEYLRTGLVKVGLGLLILGCGPLLAIIGLAAIGLWPDPNPNPIGPGMLAFLTFWPGVICLSRGIAQTRRRRSEASRL